MFFMLGLDTVRLGCQGSHTKDWLGVGEKVVAWGIQLRPYEQMLFFLPGPLSCLFVSDSGILAAIHFGTFELKLS